MAPSRLVLLLFLIAVSSQTLTEAMKIGAFNMATYGQAKMGKPNVVAEYVKIIERYDVICLQEIRDSAQTAIPFLLAEVNSKAGNDYGMIQSERLGPTSYKEQYVYFYRNNKLSVIDDYQYDEDANGDISYVKFDRPPYCALFDRLDVTSQDMLDDFVLCGIHTRPTDAVDDINHLDDVYDDVKAHWGVEDVFIIGDYNCAGSYVTDTQLAQLNMRTDRRFMWLIRDDVDTNVASGVEAYDRMNVAGLKAKTAVKKGSPGAYHFQVTEPATTESDVSDHYPVEADLHDPGESEKESIDYVTKNKAGLLVLDIMAVYPDLIAASTQGYSVTSGTDSLTVTKNNVADISGLLDSYISEFEDLMSPETKDSLDALIESNPQTGNMDFEIVYNAGFPFDYTVKLTAV